MTLSNEELERLTAPTYNPELVAELIKGLTVGVEDASELLDEGYIKVEESGRWHIPNETVWGYLEKDFPAETRKWRKAHSEQGFSNTGYSSQKQAEEDVAWFIGHGLLESDGDTYRLTDKGSGRVAESLRYWIAGNSHTPPDHVVLFYLNGTNSKDAVKAYYSVPMDEGYWNSLRKRLLATFSDEERKALGLRKNRFWKGDSAFRSLILSGLKAGK